MNVFIRACVIAVSLGIAAASCDSYKDDETPDEFLEADKDLSGEWQISSVKRNTIDISGMMDLTQFRLHLNEDGSYKLEKGLPFPVKHDGMWTVDDPTHPFSLSFTENNTMGSVEVEISYPIVQGKRQLTMTCSPGCEANKYEYTFKRIK